MKTIAGRGIPPVGRHGKVEFPGLITFAVGDVWHEGHALGQAFPDLARLWAN